MSPTGNLDCEISAQKCEPPLETKTRTVTPKDSKVTFNCSIKNGGKVQDMTWQDLERNLSANNGLFLHQSNSKDKNLSRECFSIKYASKYVLLYYSELRLPGSTLKNTLMPVRPVCSYNKSIQRIEVSHVKVFL